MHALLGRQTWAGRQRRAGRGLRRRRQRQRRQQCLGRAIRLLRAYLGSAMQPQIAKVVEGASGRPIRLSLAPVQEGEIHLGVQLAFCDGEIKCSL